MIWDTTMKKALEIIDGKSVVSNDILTNIAS